MGKGPETDPKFRGIKFQDAETLSKLGKLLDGLTAKGPFEYEVTGDGDTLVLPIGHVNLWSAHLEKVILIIL